MLARASHGSGGGGCVCQEMNRRVLSGMDYVSVYPSAPNIALRGHSVTHAAKLYPGSIVFSSVDKACLKQFFPSGPPVFVVNEVGSDWEQRKEFAG